MSHMELPLVLFTVLAQAAIGLVLLSLIYGRLAPEGTSGAIRHEPVTATVLLGAGLLASLGHLGHPVGALRTLTGLADSWLSREILVFLILSGLLALTAALALRGRFNQKLWQLTAVVGLLALLTQGMAYTLPSQPALSSGVTLAMFLLTSLALGTALGSWSAPQQRQPLLAGILTAVLVTGLVLNLILPNLWLSGGPIVEATGAAYLDSPLYWCRILVGFILPLLILARLRSIPRWLVWLVLIGEFSGRIAMFSLAANSAAFIGLPL